MLPIYTIRSSWSLALTYYQSSLCVKFVQNSYSFVGSWYKLVVSPYILRSQKRLANLIFEKRNKRSGNNGCHKEFLVSINTPILPEMSTYFVSCKIVLWVILCWYTFYFNTRNYCHNNVTTVKCMLVKLMTLEL